MATYDLNYKPNFNMFINLIFDVDDQGSFAKYVQQTCKHEHFTVLPDENIHQEKEANEPVMETMTDTDDTDLSGSNNGISDFIESWKRNMYLWYNKLILKMYTKRKAIRFFRPN